MIRVRLYQTGRALCLLQIALLIALLVSCSFESAIKLFLVHLNLGNYWVEPIRTNNSCEGDILTHLEYQDLVDEVPSRLDDNGSLCTANSPYLENNGNNDKNGRNQTEIVTPLYDEFNGTRGYNEPRDCVARQRTAVIIPYRNRQEQLDQLLAHLNPILKRQLISYQIFVIDQQGTTTFSRARLMNAGFLHVTKHYPDVFDCFIFHDVDLLLENELGLYKCSKRFPRHLSSSIDKYHYTVPWAGITGGVMAFTEPQYRKVNGFSNEYWGWGCEDDDMFIRIVNACLQLEQADKAYYTYAMIVHTYEKSYKGDSELNDYFRFKMAESANLRMDSDGINNLIYESSETESNENSTMIAADIGQPEADIKSAFQQKFKLNGQTTPKNFAHATCLSVTPIMFLLSVQTTIFIIISMLYRYFIKEWNAGAAVTNGSKTSKSNYELLENENDNDDMQSDSISIQSFDGLHRNTHKRQPSNGLDSISVQTI